VLKLTYINLEFQNFRGADPRTPCFNGRGRKWKGGEEREGKWKGRREVKDREGRGGTGRDRGGRGGMGVGEGRGRALDMGSAPRDKLWIRPCFSCFSVDKQTGTILTATITSRRNVWSATELQQ